MEKTTGNVFNIQRYTVHDGPGTRTELFLKGCPMHCLWCANPEGLDLGCEIGVYPKRCIGLDKCGLCLGLCPDGKSALIIEDNIVKAIDRDICSKCMECTDACPGNALVVWGKEMSVEEALDEIKKDLEFYGKTGGMTLSGGEPLVQWRFSSNLLKACQEEGINTCFESTFNASWEVVEKVLAHTDFIITDIKHMNPDKHKEYTGVDNQLVLENLKKISKLGIPYIIRVPIIPNHNDSLENAKETAEFIANQMGNTVKQVQLLVFHEYGITKYETLGKPYPLKNRVWPERAKQKETILAIRDVMQSYGIPAVMGSNTKI